MEGNSMLSPSKDTVSSYKIKNKLKLKNQKPHKKSGKDSGITPITVLLSLWSLRKIRQKRLCFYHVTFRV